MPEVYVPSMEGEIAVVPVLFFTHLDILKDVPVTYELADAVIKRVEEGQNPDEILIVSDGEQEFEFAPGSAANTALAVMKWFRDAIQAAGPPPGEAIY